MGILNIEDFFGKLLPTIPEKYKTNAKLQRLCGLSALETNLRDEPLVNGIKKKLLDIDFEDHTITINGKGGKKRVVPINNEWIPMKDIQKHYDNGKPPHYLNYYKCLKKSFKIIGHSPPITKGKRVQMSHCLRDYFIRDYCNFYKIENGYTNLKFLMKITGLQSLDDVEPYLKNLSQKDEFKPYRKFMK